MKRSTPWMVIACLLVGVAGWTAAGCGKKAYPVVPKQEALVQGVTDLQARMVDNQVEISWTVETTQPVPVQKFVLYRASRSLADGDCPGCPMLFTKISEWPVVSSRSGASYRMRVKDGVDPGMIYFYKVIGIDVYGHSGKDSNVAEIQP